MPDNFRYVIVSSDGLGEFWGLDVNNNPIFQEFGWPYKSYGEATFSRDDLVHMSYFCYIKKIKFKEVDSCEP